MVVNTRREQLRAAKRRQRQREREAGQAVHQVKLPTALCDRLKAGMKDAHFVERFAAFLQHELVRVDDYPGLKLLCWNLHVQYVTREDAFKLYERNWRLFDEHGLDTHERALLRELKDEFGRGFINA